MQKQMATTAPTTLPVVLPAGLPAGGAGGRGMDGIWDPCDREIQEILEMGDGQDGAPAGACWLRWLPAVAPSRYDIYLLAPSLPGYATLRLRLYGWLALAVFFVCSNAKGEILKFLVYRFALLISFFLSYFLSF